ncbi:MAG: hypothetical protein KDE31_08205 [Caldilineaceae bacterium]|nr:hypothetical protein [Caldilineaceae bacterium]
MIEEGDQNGTSEQQTIQTPGATITNSDPSFCFSAQHNGKTQTMSTLHYDPIFASIDIDLHLERVGGGNETEVYCTDDRSYVVKVKSEQAGSVAEMLAQARLLRRAARRFATVVGPAHSIPNYFLIARNQHGEAQLLVLQPFHETATPLFHIDYTQFSFTQRLAIASKLLDIIRRSLIAYGKRGWMPDLYGRSSRNPAERERLNRWYMFPWRLWSFLIQRNLLRANNLMLTAPPSAHIILVDYDPVTRSKLYQRIYYAIRAFLFVREFILIGIMVATGWVPRAP